MSHLNSDAIFDTEIWTDEALEKSAKRCNMTVQEYKTGNLLGTEITSPVLSATTGAKIPIDGGIDRVI